MDSNEKQAVASFDASNVSKPPSIRTAGSEVLTMQHDAIPESQVPTRIATPTKEFKEEDVYAVSRTPSGRSSTDENGLTRRQRVLSLFQYGTLCFTLFIVGWNDGSTGPLIPRMREVYHVRPAVLLFYLRANTLYLQVGYTVVSIIFILSCVVWSSTIPAPSGTQNHH